MAADEIPHHWRDRARGVWRVAGTVARAGARRVVRRLASDDKVFGEELAGELDKLKGMAMKVGQILSYMDGALPDDAQQALVRLQRGVEPLGFEVVRAVLEERLGGTIEERFDWFDHDPIAAASIGQVHRAGVNGVPVAVKVQYPHVMEAFEADLRQIRRLARVAGLATRVDGLAIVDDIQARLHEECDYVLEARWMRRFGLALGAVDGVVLPEVVASHSTREVLTTTWCRGDALEDFCAAGSAAARQRAARTLVRVALTSLYRFRAFHADPHPGNTLYREDGEVVLLDFGCVRELDPAWVEVDRRIVRAVVADDRAALRRAVLDSGIVAVPEARFDFEAHRAMLRWQWAPYLVPEFRFTREYLAQGAAFSGPGNANLRRMAITPEWVWVERLRWGLNSLLTKLGAEGDLRGLLHDAIDAVPEGLPEVD